MSLSPSSEMVKGLENSRVYWRSSPKGMLLLEFQARRMSPLGLAKFGPSDERFSMSLSFCWWLILNAASTRDPPTFPGGAWYSSPSHCRLSWKETFLGFLSRDSSNPDLVNRAPSQGARAWQFAIIKTPRSDASPGSLLGRIDWGRCIRLDQNHPKNRSIQCEINIVIIVNVFSGWAVLSLW